MRDRDTTPVFDAINGEISILTAKGTPSLTIPKHQHLKIKVMIYKDNSNDAIYSCFAATSGAAMCTLSGGVYNAYGTPSRPRCEPYDRCHLDGQGIVSDPGMCTNPFSAIRTGPATYFCQWCNRNL